MRSAICPARRWKLFLKKQKFLWLNCTALRHFSHNFTCHRAGAIRVCRGTACHVRGSLGILERVQSELGLTHEQVTTPDLRFTLEPVACIGACGLAPVIMIDDETHGRLTKDKVPDIIARYE